MKNYLRDEFGREIGYTIKTGIETHIFDIWGRYYGKHSDITNQVFNNLGREVGKGIELLKALLKR